MVEKVETKEKIQKCLVKNDVDPNCRIKSNKTNMCDECYHGFFYNVNNKLCQKLVGLCKDFNLTNGFCLSCYEGYNLLKDLCV